MRLLIIAFCTFMISANPATAQSNSPDRGIQVQGEGTIKVTPDRIKIKVRVENKGDEASAVKESTDKVVANVLKFLRKEKLSENDYKTDYLNLDKRTDYNTKETNYTATQAISITLHDIKRYNSIMSGLMDSGINRIDGITFEDSQLEKHQSEARIKAVKNARKKAEDYAKELGLKVGKALMVQESGTGSPAPRPMLMRANASFDSAQSSDENLAVGQIEITERVDIRFSTFDE